MSVDLYEIMRHSVRAGRITKVTVFARVRSGEIGDEARIAIKTGGTVYYGAWHDPRTDYGDDTWGDYSEEWATNPGNAHGWTWDEIDDLQIGVDLAEPVGISWNGCTQVYATIDYEALTAARTANMGAKMIAGKLI